MALVDDDEVEEIRRILAEIGRGLAVLRRPAHERLEDGEEQAAVLRHLALLADVLRRDPHHRVLGEGGERVVRLVRKDIAVGQKQDARPARRLAAQVPAAVKQLPRDLKRDERLARAGGQRKQDAVFPGGDRLQHPLDGDVLIVAPLEIAAPVLEGHGGEAVPPGVGLGKGQVPECFRRGIAGRLAFRARAACRCRRCPGRWWNRRSGWRACRRSSSPAPRPRSALRPTPWPRRQPACGCDRPARNRR